MKLAVITDSGSNLQLDYINSTKNLKYIPLQLNFDGVFYRDLFEVTAERVYEQLKDMHIKTSLPQSEDYINALEDLKKEGYTDVLVLTISKGLSGTYNGFRNLNEMVEGIKVHMYDTMTLSMAQGYLVKEAINLIKENKSIEEIFTRLDEIRYKESLAFFTVETLSYLIKGGRIGKVEGTIGNILHVKPIIAVGDDGVYHTLSKGFGMKRTYVTMRKKLKEKFGDDPVEITIHYGLHDDDAKAMADKLLSELNVKKIDITALTPVLGVHVGPEALGICARKV